VTSRPERGLDVALVDPTTLLGRDVKSVLEERGFPVRKLHLFHTGDPGSGLITDTGDEPAFVAPLETSGLEGCQVAFLCGPPEPTSRFLSRRERDACLAIALGGVRHPGAFTGLGGPGDEPPLPPGDLVLLREPPAFVLAEAIRVLQALGPLEGVTAAIDRPGSELGKEALDEMFAQAIALSTFRPLPKEILGTQIAFNLTATADSAEFETRVAGDVRELLGNDLPVSVQSIRAGTFHVHAIRVEARYRLNAPDRTAVRQALCSHAGAFVDATGEPGGGTIDAAGRDETLILRAGRSGANVHLTLASDHLRRPGAVLAVRIAERAVRDRGLLADA
jgi:aspartate-semialdehyde dehydrogenase